MLPLPMELIPGKSVRRRASSRRRAAMLLNVARPRENRWSHERVSDGRRRLRGLESIVYYVMNVYIVDN